MSATLPFISASRGAPNRSTGPHPCSRSPDGFRGPLACELNRDAQTLNSRCVPLLLSHHGSHLSPESERLATSIDQNKHGSAADTPHAFCASAIYGVFWLGSLFRGYGTEQEVVDPIPSPSAGCGR